MSDPSDIQVEVSDQGVAPTEEVAEHEEQEVTGAEQETPEEEDHGDDAGDESEQPDEESHEDDVPYGVRKKLGKLTARVKERDEKLAAQETEIRQAREELEFLRKAQTPVKQVENTPFPELADSDFDQEKYRQRIEAWTQSQAELKVQQVQHDQENAKRSEAYSAKVAVFAADKPQWAEQTARIPATDAMVEVIQDMDNGPAVTYYLAQHLNEAIDISRMAPHLAAIKLAKIEAKVTTNAPPVAKNITGAPAPIKTLSTSSPIKKDLADLPMSEYIKERNKSRKKSGGFL